MYKCQRASSASQETGINLFRLLRLTSGFCLIAMTVDEESRSLHGARHSNSRLMYDQVPVLSIGLRGTSLECHFFYFFILIYMYFEYFCPDV